MSVSQPLLDDDLGVEAHLVRNVDVSDVNADEAVGVHGAHVVGEADFVNWRASGGRLDDGQANALRLAPSF